MHSKSPAVRNGHRRVVGKLLAFVDGRRMGRGCQVVDQQLIHVIGFHCFCVCRRLGSPLGPEAAMNGGMGERRIQAISGHWSASQGIYRNGLSCRSVSPEADIHF